MISKDNNNRLGFISTQEKQFNSVPNLRMHETDRVISEIRSQISYVLHKFFQLIAIN